jgi:hypothetical protein
MSATVIKGPQIPMFQLIMITSAMRLYINTGMKANRSYTPANMLAYASTLTGKTYKRTALKEAYNDLREGFPDAQIRPL